MTRPSNYGKVTHNKEATENVMYLFVLTQEKYWLLISRIHVNVFVSYASEVEQVFCAEDSYRTC
jgi:hypothetical protein